jgi:hypothetical protein
VVAVKGRPRQPALPAPQSPSLVSRPEHLGPRDTIFFVPIRIWTVIFAALGAWRLAAGG